MRVDIERSYCAERINAIVNHPSVYPWVKGTIEGPIDLSDVVADTRHVLLVGEHGGVLFIQHHPLLYEAHTQVLPEGRGKWAFGMARAALHWMFCRTGAQEIVTKIPRGNHAARGLTTALKFRCEFTAARGWVMAGKVVPADIVTLPIQQWMHDAPGLEERGQWFHRRLTQEYERLGKTEQRHHDDASHDRYVGAAAEMLLGGQPHKAAHFYNRWAVMAGYEPIAVLSEDDPVTIDIRDAILVMRGDDFEVQRCR